MTAKIMFSSITKSTGGQQSANGQFCNDDGTQKWGNINMNSGGPTPPGMPSAIQPVAPPAMAFDTLNCDIIYELNLVEVPAKP